MENHDEQEWLDGGYEPGPEVVFCLLCKKELEWDNGLVYDGGFMLISFHFGSRHDQGKGLTSKPIENPVARHEYLLNCHEIEAFICDDCFEENAKSPNVIRGHNIIQTRERERII